MTAGLTDKLGIGMTGSGKSFTISNLRCTGVGFHIELTTETVNNNIKVQLTHTGDNSLSGLFVAMDLEGGIFFSKSNKTFIQFITVSGGFGLNGNGDNRFGEAHGLKNDGFFCKAEGITGGHILQTAHSSDIAGEHLFVLDLLIGVHLKDTAEAFTLTGTGVQNRHTLSRHTGVNAEVVEFTHIRIAHDLEDKSGERLHVTDVTGHLSAGGRIGTGDFPGIDGAGEIVNDHIQDHLNTAALEGRGASHGNDLCSNSCFAQSSTECIHIGSLFFKEEFHHLIIAACDSFIEFHESFLTLCGKITGQFFFTDGHTFVFGIKVESLAAENIDHTLEVCFLTDRQSHADRNGTQLGADLIDHTVKVGTGTIHLVDESNDRHIVFLSLTPHGFRLGLHFTDSAENSDSTVKNAQRALHFSCEVHVSGGIDNIDLAAFPITGGGSRGNGNTTFTFLFHPVGGGGTFMGITDFVVHAGIEKDTLSKSGLTCINVSHDTDVAHIFERNLTVR